MEPDKRKVGEIYVLPSPRFINSKSLSNVDLQCTTIIATSEKSEQISDSRPADDQTRCNVIQLRFIITHFKDNNFTLCPKTREWIRYTAVFVVSNCFWSPCVKIVRASTIVRKYTGIGGGKRTTPFSSDSHLSRTEAKFLKGEFLGQSLENNIIRKTLAGSRAELDRDRDRQTDRQTETEAAIYTHSSLSSKDT